MGDKKIEIETKNLIKATTATLQYLNYFNRKKLVLNKSFFLMIHKILLAYKSKEAGKYRTSLYKLTIKGKTFIPTEPWKIEHEIIELIDFINNKYGWGPVYRWYFLNKIKNKRLSNKASKIMYKIFMAWYLHHRLTIIHPFTDGNGRMSRLLMCLVLKFEGLSDVTYPALINLIIKEDKTKYLNCLNDADKGNYISGVDYMFTVLNLAYEMTIKESNKLKRKHKNK